MSKLQSKIQKWKSVVHYRWEQHRQVLLILLPLLFFFPMVKIIQLLQPIEPLDELNELYLSKNYDQLYELSQKYRKDFPLDQTRLTYFQASSGLLGNIDDPAPFFLLLYVDKTGSYTKKLIKKVMQEKPGTPFAAMFISFLATESALDKSLVKQVIKTDTKWNLDYVNSKELFAAVSGLFPERIHKLSKEKVLKVNDQKSIALEQGSLLLLRNKVSFDRASKSNSTVHYFVFTESGEQGVAAFSKNEIEKNL